MRAWLGLAVVLAVAGCGGREAEHDAGEGSADAAIDAIPMTVFVENESTCTYHDYGSRCRVACYLPPDVPIILSVAWSGPYCCNPPYGRETFLNCRCIDGRVLCPRYRTESMLDVPASRCELCPGTPSGPSLDTGVGDGGWDASVGEDAGSGPSVGEDAGG